MLRPVLAVFVFFSMTSLNAYALNNKVSSACVKLFDYLRNSGEIISPASVEAILQFPENFDPNATPRPDPFAEVDRAATYVERYLPPVDREDATTLAEHRAYVLETLLAEIAEVYPVWQATVSRLDNGDFYFTGG